jgi:hypothetical protein
MIAARQGDAKHSFHFTYAIAPAQDATPRAAPESNDGAQEIL